MVLKTEQLIGLKVRTQSGQFVGRVHDLELDSDTLKIINILVSRSKLLEKILNEDLIVNTNMIISVSSKEVIIEDSFIEISQISNQTVSI